MANAKRALALF